MYKHEDKKATQACIQRVVQLINDELSKMDDSSEEETQRVQSPVHVPTVKVQSLCVVRPKFKLENPVPRIKFQMPTRVSTVNPVRKIEYKIPTHVYTHSNKSLENPVGILQSPESTEASAFNRRRRHRDTNSRND